MSRFGKDLIQSLGEAVAHAEGKGPARLHQPLDPADVRKRAKLSAGDEVTAVLTLFH